MKIGIVVSGLPASGKTTVARELATRLHFDFLDKDDFLEALYERYGVFSWEHRKRLSRESDVSFRNNAAKAGSAVLVSHWRPLGSDGDSGTPVEWLEDEYDLIVEVYCQCTPELAFARFTNRTRHPGHYDKHRNLEDLKMRMSSWAARFPLRLGSLVCVRSDEEVDPDALCKTVQKTIAERV